MTESSLIKTAEFALRFRRPQAVGPGLLNGAVCSALAVGPPGTRHCDRLFFDTADLRLAARGMFVSLHSVEAGQALEAVHRTGPSPMAYERAQGVMLDRPPVADDLPPAFGKAIAGAELAPLFRARLAIDHRELAIEDSTVAATVETGSLLAGGVEAPVATLTLTLKVGEPAHVLDLGLALAAEYGLRPTFEDIAADGARLMRGAGLAAPEPVFAKDAGLAPGETVGEALAAVFAACTVQIAGNEAACRDGRRIEGVHQMRVAIRRLRAALAAFQPALPPALHAQLEADARALMHPLGAARDLDVFLDETAAPLGARMPGEAGLAALFAAARIRRDEAYEALRRALDGPKLARLLLLPELWRLRETARLAAKTQAQDHAAVKGAPPDPPPAQAVSDAPPAVREDPAAFADALDEKAGAVAARALERRCKRVLKAGKAVEDQPPEALHDLRLMIKKLRYQAEFFAELFPRARTRPFLKPLKTLQDELGLVQDALVAADLAEEIATKAAAASPDDAAALLRAAGVVAGWRTAQADARAADAHARWRAFRDAKAFWR